MKKIKKNRGEKKNLNKIKTVDILDKNGKVIDTIIPIEDSNVHDVCKCESYD